jgi:hypothetical protein
MQEFAMIREIPGHSLEGAIRLLNDLQWNIRVVESEGSPSVGGGHKLLFQTTSREAADAFLYGLALAYSVLPKEIFNQVKKYGEDAAG